MNRMVKKILISGIIIGIFFNWVSEAVEKSVKIKNSFLQEENRDTLKKEEPNLKKGTGIYLELASKEVILSKEEQELIDLINNFRKEKKVPILKIDSVLCNVAKQHSREMTEMNYLNPKSPVKGTPNERAVKAGVWDYPIFTLVGKCASVEKLYQHFKKEDEQKLLEPSITHLGIGIIISEEGEMIGTLHLIRRIVKIDPLFAMSVGRNKGRAFTICGNTQMKYLKFLVFDASLCSSLDECISSEPYSTKEIEVPKGGKFETSLKLTPYLNDPFIVIIKAKNKQKEEFFITNCILQSTEAKREDVKEK